MNLWANGAGLTIRNSRLLSAVAYPVYVFGSGRGSLFVPEMDETAFPPLEQSTFPRTVLRRGLRRLLGLHFSNSKTERVGKTMIQ
jgi:hypothetical protein